MDNFIVDASAHGRTVQIYYTFMKGSCNDHRKYLTEKFSVKIMSNVGFLFHKDSYTMLKE